MEVQLFILFYPFFFIMDPSLLTNSLPIPHSAFAFMKPTWPRTPTHEHTNGKKTQPKKTKQNHPPSPITGRHKKEVAQYGRAHQTGLAGD